MEPTASNVADMLCLRRRKVRRCAMNAAQIYSCLRDLQVVASIPRISEEEIRELTRLKLIQRAKTSGGIFLTPLGVHAKTGQIQVDSL